MTVEQAARELNLTTADVVYRLLRVGKLRGHKNAGRWIVDDASVRERRASVERKKSSRVHAGTARKEARARVEGLFK
jgi:hypothetical protein